MPTKKDKEKKEKKPRGRPRKVVKQTQTQKQVVIVNVDTKKRGRPRKQATTEKLSLLPPTLIRLNQPPVPFPQQPTLNVVRESVKPIGSESVINTLQQQYQQDYDRFQGERLAAKLFESAMKKEGRDEELYPNTPHRDPLVANTPVSQGVMYAEAQIAPSSAITEAEAREIKKRGRPPYTPEQRAEAERLRQEKKQEKKQAGLKQP
jgi:hypothetical protein